MGVVVILIKLNYIIELRCLFRHTIVIFYINPEYQERDRCHIHDFEKGVSFLEHREQWGTRLGFILAAAGSAIGLGNIWRFPYVAYENGGGAFLVPYLFALLTAGIPILILEFGIGRSQRGSAPLSLRRLSSKLEWLGWWQVLLSFVIITYYSVVIAWAMSYFKYSFGLEWGQDTKAFLFGTYLQVPDGAVTEAGWNLGGLQWHILIPLILVWGIVFYTIVRGIQKGIEKVSRIFMPILVIMMVIFVIRAVTLPGAAIGLDHLLTPDFSKIFPGFLGGDNPKWYTVWMAAYGQIFFSLSIAFAIMITYASYLPKKNDVNNSGFIMAFSNSGFEFLAAIGVFAAIGFMAHATGSDVSEVASAGVGLAFVVFPQIINTFPAFNGLFGALFFLTLVIAGFTSAISIVEVVVSGLMDKLNMARNKAVAWVCGLGFLISLLYVTGAGIIFLDIVDHFINNFGIVISGLLEVALVGWIVNLKKIQEENNLVSDFAIGAWWPFMIRILTPIILIYMSYVNFVEEFSKAYEGYPFHALYTFGWGTVGASIIVALVLTYALRWNPEAIKGEKEVSQP
jgi:NSS family neurotransmitter:Na+ symporter